MGAIKRIIEKKLCRTEVHVEYIPDYPYMSESQFRGKNILILGGSGDIGKKIAERFLQAGATVYLSGTSKDSMNKTIDTLKEKYTFVYGCLCDLRNIGEIQKLVENCFKSKGLEIDIFVNCAGQLGETSFRTGCQGFWEIDECEWDDVMDINLKGAFFACQFVSAYMIEKRTKGIIINICSTTAYRAAVTPYAYSKTGLAELTQGMARLCMPKGIRVNGVSPGPVATKMMGFKEEDNNYYAESHYDLRYALPADVANTVFFLATDYSKHIVGQIIVCDGGESIH